MNAKQFLTAVAGVILVVACLMLFSILFLASMGMLVASVHNEAKALIFGVIEIVSMSLVTIAIALKLDKVGVPLWVFMTLIITIPAGTMTILALLMSIL